MQAIRNGVRVGLGDTSSDLRPPRIMTGVVAAFRLAAAASALAASAHFRHSTSAALVARVTRTEGTVSSA
jgi:hypothetical protein